MGLFKWFANLYVFWKLPCFEIWAVQVEQKQLSNPTYVLGNIDSSNADHRYNKIADSMNGIIEHLNTNYLLIIYFICYMRVFRINHVIVYSSKYFIKINKINYVKKTEHKTVLKMQLIFK